MGYTVVNGYMNDDILCRTDSGYGNIAFMNLENLTDISGIGVSSYNLDTLKAYKGLHLEGDVLYAYTTNSIYIYDASYALKRVSKQDSYVLKGSFSLLGTINNIKGDFIDNYVSGNHAQGGAIQNEGYITNAIEGNFKNNYAIGVNDPARGGAIYVGPGAEKCYIGDSVFIENSVQNITSNLSQLFSAPRIICA